MRNLSVKLNGSLLSAALMAKGQLRGGTSAPKKSVDGVEVTPFKYGAPAAACISADFELNWAWRSLPPPEADLHGESTRKNLPLILAVAREHDIPITWATVGHLFLSECHKRNGVPHHDMPRPRRNDLWDGDWYRHDPCTDVHQHPLWYAPDLIETVLAEDLAHEFGCHSFSHIDFAPGYAHDELVRSELHACSLAMAPFGLHSRSLVFPFNHNGEDLDVLSSMGITSVRWRDSNIVLSYPERSRSGTYRIYESMSLRAPQHYDLVDKCEIVLRRAVELGAAYHFWFHPSDPAALFENEFREVLAHVAAQRDRGLVWAATMADITAYCESRAALEFAVTRAADAVTVTMKNRADISKYGSADLTLMVSDCERPRMICAVGPRGERTLDSSAAVCDVARKRVLITVPHDTTTLRVLH
jgi:peptidoglycan/xylan/chitin deacetylase (PgdA/CDA1 family)